MQLPVLKCSILFCLMTNFLYADRNCLALGLLLCPPIALTLPKNNSRWSCKGCAKWSHIQDLYNIDSAILDCKMLPRITDQHVVPEKILKMKVKCAIQIFSQRVSSTMMFLSCK